MLGLNPKPPKFVKVYGDLGDGIKRAVRTYADEVKSRTFPGKDNTYS